MRLNKILLLILFLVPLIFIGTLLAAPMKTETTKEYFASHASTNDECHFCQRIIGFAIAILPKCPQHGETSGVLERICQEVSLSDISQECERFLRKVNKGSESLLVAGGQCLGDTRTLCGPTHLSCCHFLSE